MPERWDAYLPDGRKAGRTLTRGEVIPAGLYHLFTDVLVKHVDGDYLVTQRDSRMESYPGKFEAGSGGAVLAGETPYEGALRELKEETGIQATGLTFLFAFSNLQDAICYCYVCITNCDKRSITLQEGETIAYRWLSEGDFFDFTQTDAFASGFIKRWHPYLETVRSLGK